MSVESVKEAMNWLAEQDNTLFIGQNIKYCTTPLSVYKALEDVSDDKKMEFPVAEEFQMGFSLGVSLTGRVPITIYPRFDFLILATNQLVNHVDKIQYMTKGKFGFPKIIVRTFVGKTKPLHPGLQHMQNHTEAFKLMLEFMNVVELTSDDCAMSVYQKAYYSCQSTLVVEL
jgi:pyruvate/2-oxoglutarate/acetoin dehydrogenase E1 component